MRTLFIIHDPPYGTERVYNALRLAHALIRKDSASEITIFLIADAVLAATASLISHPGTLRGPALVWYFLRPSKSS
jgi:sulfur relay (sulfurtransferase) complex TusBCD TusD component (DsrE family)